LTTWPVNAILRVAHPRKGIGGEIASSIKLPLS
jgi:hypothetical protein